MNLRKLLFMKATKGGSGPAYVNLLNAEDVTKYPEWLSTYTFSKGSIEISSVEGGNSDYVHYGTVIPAGTYTMSCKISGAGIIGPRFLCGASFAGGSYLEYYGGYYEDMQDNKITFTVSEDCWVGLVFITGTEHEPGKIYDIMLEEGNTAHSYVPYKG